MYNKSIEEVYSLVKSSESGLTSNEVNTRVKVLLADNHHIENIRNDNELMFYLNRVQIKFEYEDVIRNPDALERFMSE